MGGRDKLAEVVDGRPLLAHAVAAVAAAPEVDRMVIVTAADRVASIASAAWLPDTVVAVVAGGSRRQESVRLGFDALNGAASTPLRFPTGLAKPGAERPRPVADRRVVLVHDGARPLVPTALVSAVARAAAEHGAAIPVLPVGDTIKRVGVDGTVTDAGDRSELAAAQTPQGIRSDLLRMAWDAVPADGDRTFTDEAALLEACRIAVHAIPGDERNFKVTGPGDLDRVRAAVADAASVGPGAATVTSRTGFGSDAHPFGPGSGLVLGGVVVPAVPRLSGHSDGDVVLHAVADALLGAAGLGDLGRIFPAGPETPSGIDSAELLGEVVRRVRATGLRISSLDCTIVAARPRLASILPAIGDRIATLVGVDAANVNVKASTGNLAGMEGAGRGIAAQVVVVLGASNGSGAS